MGNGQRQPSQGQGPARIGAFMKGHFMLRLMKRQHVSGMETDQRAKVLDVDKPGREGMLSDWQHRS